MAWWDSLAKIGGAVAAPFTGGLSLWPSLALAGGSAAAGYGLSKLGGGKNDETATGGVENQLAASAKQKGTQGEDLINQGSDALGNAMQYLQALTGNNPGALMSALAPQAGRVMDQYDTARTAISNFSPRGGAAASVGAQSQLAEASDLSNLTSTARQQAFGQTADLGTQLTGLGLSAEQLESADLNALLQSILTREGHDIGKRGQNMEALGGLGEALGTILAAKIFKGPQ